MVVSLIWTVSLAEIVSELVGTADFFHHRSQERNPECGRTFRHYPTGISAAEQTDRLQAAAAMLWALGLSVRVATAVLALFQAPICHQTVWRDGIALAQQLACRRRVGRVRVLGVDGSGARIGGRSSGIVVAVDMGTGDPVVMVELDERNPEAVLDWLAPLVEQLGVEVIVTDDLNLYGPMAKMLDVDRQLCTFHVKSLTRAQGAQEISGRNWFPEGPVS